MSTSTATQVAAEVDKNKCIALGDPINLICLFKFSAEDGCIEDFENTAGYSRDYQAMQECMCDTEHMFQCPDSTRDSEITALARSIQNEGVLDSTLDKIMSQLVRYKLDQYVFNSNTWCLMSLNFLWFKFIYMCCFTYFLLFI